MFDVLSMFSYTFIKIFQTVTEKWDNKHEPSHSILLNTLADSTFFPEKLQSLTFAFSVADQLHSTKTLPNTTNSNL